MIKKTLYPKTTRFSTKSETVVTEKIDGSNLAFFKQEGELFIAQRNYIFSFNEIEEVQKQIYKGLYGWLKGNGEHLKESLNENSCIVGEWLGMGHIKYAETFDSRFLMFAKANVNHKQELFNILYLKELFIYPFVDGEIPEYIGIVPIAYRGEPLMLDDLNDLYDEYSERVGRKVEGFIISDGVSARKYVRFKDGKLTDHKDKV